MMDRSFLHSTEHRLNYIQELRRRRERNKMNIVGPKPDEEVSTLDASSHSTSNPDLGQEAASQVK